MLITFDVIHFKQVIGGWTNLRKGMVLRKRLFPEKVKVYQKQSVITQNNDLKKILKDYQPNDIFYADERGHFYKCLPNRILTYRQ